MSYVTPAQVRAKLQMSETDWPNATLEGSPFITLGDAWLEKCLDDAGLEYDDLTAGKQTFACQAELCWVAAEVCRAEGRKAAASGTDFKAGPVSVKGITAAGWEAEAKKLLTECEGWLNRAGATMDTNVSGFEMIGGIFGNDVDGDYDTTPNDYQILDPDSVEE